METRHKRQNTGVLLLHSFVAASCVFFPLSIFCVSTGNNFISSGFLKSAFLVSFFFFLMDYPSCIYSFTFSRALHVVCAVVVDTAGNVTWQLLLHKLLSHVMSLGLVSVCYFVFNVGSPSHEKRVCGHIQRGHLMLVSPAGEMNVVFSWSHTRNSLHQIPLVEWV